MHFTKLVLFFVLITSLIHSESRIEEQSNYIIYLKGTCSSGKSTFMRSLSSRCDNLEIVDEDAIMHRSYVEAVAEKYPQKFCCIRVAIAQENLYHALRENDILFKKNVTHEERAKALNALGWVQEELNKSENIAWKQEVSRGIDAQVLGHIQEAIKMKKNVILDSWYINANDLSVHFPKTRIIRVLIYCPLQIAYERLLKRNAEALMQEDLSEKRYLRQLVGSFFSLYEINAHPLQKIQEIKKHEFDEVLEAISQSLSGSNPKYEKRNFTFEEISKVCFLKMKADFLKPFNGPGEVFYVSPKEEQDIIIDSVLKRQ